MHILAKNKNKRVVVLSCKELLMLEGKGNLPVVSGMYKPGTQIEIAAMWAKLTEVAGNIPEMNNLVIKLRQAADSIENATPSP